MNGRKKRVYQFDFVGNLIAEYESCDEAARATGITQGGVVNALKRSSRTRVGVFSATTAPPQVGVNKSGSKSPVRYRGKVYASTRGLARGLESLFAQLSDGIEPDIVDE